MIYKCSNVLSNYPKPLPVQTRFRIRLPLGMWQSCTFLVLLFFIVSILIIPCHLKTQGFVYSLTFLRYSIEYIAQDCWIYLGLGCACDWIATSGRCNLDE